MAEVKKEEIIVAFDIEKAGCLPVGHPIIAIGYCIGTTTEFLRKGRFTFAVKWPNGDDYGQFEKRCWDEFWSKQKPELIELLKTGTVEFSEFVKFLDGLELDYPDDQYKIRFLSDNPSFDIGGLDAVLEIYGRIPTRYTRTGKYRSITDPEEQLYMLPQPTIDAIKKSIVVEHDHDPANDAEYIYRTYLGVLAATKKSIAADDTKYIFSGAVTTNYS